MSLPKLSVKRPVTITMIYLGIVLFGIISFKMLKIELLPSMDIPKIVVETKVPNTPPEEVDSNVTYKLENQLSTLPNVKKIYSTSTEGRSLVTVEFYWNTDMKYTILKAREKLDNVKDNLGDAEKPNILYFDPAQAPIMQLVVESDMSFSELSDYTRDLVKRRLERVEGVALCEVVGDEKEEITIVVPNRNLVSYNITFDDIKNVLSKNNFIGSAGEIEDDNFSYSLSFDRNDYSVEELQDLKIRGNLRLGDVAKIVKGAAKNDEYSKFNGKKTISLLLIKSSSANTVKVAKEVRKVIRELNDSSNSTKLKILYDDSETIKNAINNVLLSILIGGILAFFVLFIFLHDFKSPFIIGLSMPLSIITVFIVLYIARVSINILSLGGLAIGIGLLVDNSIVVLENMDRYLNEGMSLKDAAIKGASEVSLPILAGTLTTVAVFLPVLYLKGVIAVLFKQQAFVITVSLFASLIVALTIVPMIFSRNYKSINGINAFVIRKGRRFFDYFDNILEKWMTLYEKLLNKALKNSKKAILYTALTLLISSSLLLFIKKEFVPQVKDNRFFMEYKLPTGVTIDANEKYVKFLENIVAAKKDWIDYYVVNLGKTYGNDIAGTNTGYVLFATKKISQVQKLKDYLLKSLSSLNGTITFYSAGNIYNQFFDFGEYDLDVMLEGDSIENLNRYANALKKEMGKIKGIHSVIKDMELKREIIELKFKKYFLNSTNVSLYDVINKIKQATIGEKALSVYDMNKEIDVWVKNDTNVPGYDTFLERMININGQRYKIRDIVDLRRIKVPNEIKREDQRRKISLLCNIRGIGLERAIFEIRKAFEKLSPDSNIKLKFGGKIGNMKNSFNGLIFAFILSIILVYMILGIQFESFSQPIIILLAVPLSLIGVFLALFLTKTSINIMSLMGMVVLVGIVVNDSIVKIDIINRLRNEGYELIDAVKKGGTLRFRPILMTSFTTILGLIPLAIGIGKGSELSKPLAITIIGGLTTSTILTLIIIPVIYVSFVKRFEKKSN